MTTAFAKKHAPEILVFCCALGVRLIYLWQSSDNPTFAVPVLDAKTYHHLASALAAGEPVDHSFFWQPVFYPLFLTVVYAVFGISIVAAKLCLILVDSLTCVLTFALARRIFSVRAGAIAGLIMAFYGPAVFYSGQLLGTSWACFWTVALLLLLLRTAETSRRYLFFLVVVVGILAVLTRPTFLLFVPLACAWVLWKLFRRNLPKGQIAIFAGLIMLGALLVALPVSVKRRAHLGSHSILPTSGGINLHLGNNPDRCAAVRIRPGHGWTELTKEPTKHGAQGPADGADYFYGLTWDYIQNDPLGFAGGLLFKSLQFVHATEIPRNTDIYVHAKWSPVLAALTWRAGVFGFPFGLLLPLAVLGAMLRRRQIPFCVFLFPVAYAAVVILVFVSGRYRMPVIPVLAVLAAGGLEALFSERRRQWSLKQWALAGAPAVAAVGLSLLPVSRCERGIDFESEMYFLVGDRHLAAEDLAAAQRFLARSVAMNPDNASARFSLGRALEQAGKYEDALAHFKAATDIYPDHKSAKIGFARILVRIKRDRAAMAFLDRSSDDSPESAEPYFRIGVDLFNAREYARAAPFFERGLQLNPSFEEPFGNLGQAYRRLKRYRDAERTYRHALKRFPRQSAFHFMLGTVLVAQGRHDEAAAALQRAILLAPKNGEYYHYLVALHIKRNDTAAAAQVLGMLKQVSLKWYEKARILF